MTGRSSYLSFGLAIVAAVVIAYSVSMLARNVWGLTGTAIRTDALELAGVTAGLMLTEALIARRRRGGDRE